MQYWWYC